MRLTAIICLIIFGLSALWIGIGAFYTAADEPNQYRFDGVYAAEGTTLTVKNGELALVNGMGFAVDQPLRRVIEQTLWGLSSLMALISGMMLLKMDRKLNSKKIIYTK